MDWRLSGNAESVTLYFRVEGQPVIPDAGTELGFTARNNAGQVVQKYAFTQPPDAIPTQMTVPLSLDLSQLPDGVLFESRYFRADFMYKGSPYFVECSYRIHKFVPMTASPQAVRAIIGADYDELSDADISVFGAYVELLSKMPLSLDIALARPDRIGIRANESIALQAVLNVLPSLQARILKLEKRDNSELQRSTIDFEKLEFDVRSKLQENIALIIAEIDLVETATVVPNLFDVATQTDRITNA